MISVFIDQYVVLNQQYHLHYLGNGSILRKSKSEFVPFEEAETDILQIISSGDRTVRTAIEKVTELYGDKEYVASLVQRFLSKLNTYGIVKFQNCPGNPVASTGKRGYYYPLSISFEVTSSCNLSCIHCYLECSNSGLFTDINVVESLRKLKGKSLEVHMTGGEPLLHPKLGQIIEMLSECFSLALATNGTLIELYPGQVRQFDSIQVPLYGDTPELHDSHTKAKGSFEKTCRGIRVATELDVPVIVTSTLTPFNYTRVKQMAELAKSLGANGFKAGTVGVTGRANDELVLDFSQMELVRTQLLAINRTHQFVNVWRTERWLPMKLRRNELPSCGAGDISWCVDSLGRVRACEMVTYKDLGMGRLEEDLDALISRHYAMKTPNEERLKEMGKICPAFTHHGGVHVDSCT